jgi:hypothetical protein
MQLLRFGCQSFTPHKWEQLENNCCRIRAKTSNQDDAKAQRANKITTC